MYISCEIEFTTEDSYFTANTRCNSLHTFSSLPIFWQGLLWNCFFGRVNTVNLYGVLRMVAYWGKLKMGWAMIIPLSSISITAQRHFVFWWPFRFIRLSIYPFVCWLLVPYVRLHFNLGVNSFAMNMVWLIPFVEYFKRFIHYIVA